MNIRAFRLPSLSICALLLGAATPVALGQSYWSEGHGDIGIGLVQVPHGNHFHDQLAPSGWNVDAGGVVNGTELTTGQSYKPDQLVAWVQKTQTSTAAMVDVLGIPAGSDVYRAGNHTYQPNIGFAAYGIGDETDWLDEHGVVNGGVSVSLTGWSTPAGANFALISRNSNVFSTFDPTATQPVQDDPEESGYNPLGNNSFFLFAGGHEHFGLYFTHEGFYELTFTWSGYHEHEGYLETSATYGFQVGAIPEPAEWALIFSASIGLGVVIARRRKRS